MQPPPETDDIKVLRLWCEEFFDHFTRIGQGLGGWENLTSSEQADPTWQDIIDTMENGILRRS